MSIEAMKQEPVGYLYDWLNPDNRDEVIRDWFAALQMALDALKDAALCVQHNSCPPDGGNDWDEQIEALRDRLAQPEKVWVGLTEEERAKCWTTSAVQTAINIEAKLKEKNDGNTN
jgi:hypothetical protein